MSARPTTERARLDRRIDDPLAETAGRVAQIALTLRQKKLQENQERFLARLIAKSPVAVNEARLKKLFESAP